jgi:hypothetical protein
MYAAEYTNPSIHRYKTIWGDSAGTWLADSLKLHMDVLPTSPLPSNPFDPNLETLAIGVASAVLDAAANIFVFTCPLEAAQMAARKLYAANFYGYGFVVILAPHLVTPLLWQSDPILYHFFRGSIAIQVQSYGAVSFKYSYQAVFGQNPGMIGLDSSCFQCRGFFVCLFSGTFSRQAYDATMLLAKAIGSARASCLDPQNPDVLLSSARSVSFFGASGDVAFSSSSNDRVAASSLGSPSPIFEIHNVIEMNIRHVRHIYCVSHLVAIDFIHDFVLPKSVHFRSDLQIEISFRSSSTILFSPGLPTSFRVSSS